MASGGRLTQVTAALALDGAKQKVPREGSELERCRLDKPTCLPIIVLGRTACHLPLVGL